MRIAMVAACPFPSPQGSQVFVEQMCERLAAAGHDVHLLTYGQGRQVVDRGYTHHRIRRLPWDDAMRSGPTPMKPVLDGVMVVALARLLARHRFDVVHCHNYEAAAIGIAARMLRGVPVVYHSHNLMGDELATYFATPTVKRAAGAAGRLLDRTVPAAADRVIALCDLSAEELRHAGTAGDTISVIPPAVEDDGVGGDIAAARARLDLEPAERTACLVGYCGNVDGYQNLDLLLDGFEAAAREPGGESLRLLAITHRADARFDRTLSRRGLAGRVRRLTGRDYAHARLAMAACDVLVLPRRRGSGYPIKLLNYMCLERAIVTAGCGGKVLRDGEEALVVDDGDPAGMAAALLRLRSDASLRARLGEEARRHYLRDLTWDAVLPAIEDAYARAVAARPQAYAAPAV